MDENPTSAAPPSDPTDRPVGIPEIAERLGTSRGVVDSWILRSGKGSTKRQPHPFPARQPTEVGGSPWWWWSTIEDWLIISERVAGPPAPPR